MNHHTIRRLEYGSHFSTPMKDSYSEIFISENYGSDKIVILFNELHPHWGEFFTTKYFFFETPREMSWGHNGEVMKILVI